MFKNFTEDSFSIKLTKLSKNIQGLNFGLSFLLRTSFCLKSLYFEHREYFKNKYLPSSYLKAVGDVYTALVLLTLICLFLSICYMQVWVLDSVLTMTSHNRGQHFKIPKNWYQNPVSYLKIYILIKSVIYYNLYL